MNYQKTTRIAALTWIFCGFVTVALGQQTMETPDFTDQQFDQFVEINLEIIPVQQEAQQDMVKAISNEGMEAERFQQLAQAQQQGTLKDLASDVDEITAFNNAGQKVMEIQQEMRLEMQQAINDSDMSMQTFQQFSTAYNQDQDVRSKVDQMLAKEMKGN